MEIQIIETAFRTEVNCLFRNREINANEQHYQMRENNRREQ